MSYCRFGKDSDVYMYPSFDGIVCCSCRLDENKWQDRVFQTPLEAIEHLREHQIAGHQVCNFALGRLRQEAIIPLDDGTKAI
jgi:hypothetical protein